MQNKTYWFYDRKYQFYLDFLAGGFSALGAYAFISEVKYGHDLYVSSPSLNKFTYAQNIFQQMLLSLPRIDLFELILLGGKPAIAFSVKDALKRKLISEGNPKASPIKFYSCFFLNGGVASVVAKLLTYPFDSSRMKFDPTLVKSANELTISANLQCVAQVIKKDGYLGLYQGFGVSVLGAFIYGTIFFGGFDVGKRVILGDETEKGNSNFFPRAILASIVVTIGKFFQNPFLIVESQMIEERKKHNYAVKYFLSRELLIASKKFIKKKDLGDFLVEALHSMYMKRIRLQ